MQPKFKLRSGFRCGTSSQDTCTVLVVVSPLRVIAGAVDFHTSQCEGLYQDAMVGALCQKRLAYAQLVDRADVLVRTESSLAPAKSRPELSCSQRDKNDIRVDFSSSSMSVLGTDVVDMPSTYKILPVYDQPLQSAELPAAGVDAARDLVRKYLLVQRLKIAFRRFWVSLLLAARLRVQLAASLHMGRNHCCKTALQLWRNFSVTFFRRQVAWRTAVIFGSSCVKAVLLVALRSFRADATHSNSGMGVDGNVVLDFAVQRGVSFYARKRLTKVLKFLQLYADTDSGGGKGYRAVSRCRAVMYYRRKQLLSARQQLRANFKRILQIQGDNENARSHYMGVSVFSDGDA